MVLSYKKTRKRFAVLFSGLQKNYEPFIKNQLKCLIEVNNCDVFIYTSNDSQNRYVENSTVKYIKETKYFNDNDYFLKAYAPHIKDIYIDLDENHFNKFRNEYFGDCRNNFHLNLIKAYFKVYSVIKMMEDYEVENNIKYDGVLRARLDAFYLRKINLEKLDLNKTYCSISNDTFHRDDAGIFMQRKKIHYLKNFVFSLIEKRDQQPNIIVEQQLFSYIKKNSKIKFIPNFINRVGCPPTLKYKKVPFLNKKDFNNLVSMEYNIKWDTPSEVFHRKLKKNNYLAFIKHKIKRIIKD